MRDLNYNQLAKELVRALRGNRLQTELSQLLGYSFNQVGKWETGHKIIDWASFLRLADLVHIPVKESFNQVFAFHNGLKLENKSVVDILLPLQGETSVRQQAAQMRKSPAAMGRLMQGQVQPSLADVVHLMDARPSILINWVGLWAEPEQIPTLQLRVQTEKNATKKIFHYPESILVNAALHLESSQNDEINQISFIMEATALEKDQVIQALEILQDVGWVEFKNGRCTSHLKDITFLRSPEYRYVTALLLNKISKSFKVSAPHPPNRNRPSITANRTYPVSDQAAQQIADAIVNFHHQISKILKEDSAPKTHIRTVMMHSLDLSKL